MNCIVRHKTIDFLRKGLRASQRELIDSDIIAEYSSDSSSKRASELGTLSLLLKSIRPDYRRAIVHTRIIGRSIEETAAELGVSSSSVKIWVHRGMKELQKAAKKHEDER
jgi:RNA polymerase sigma factor (sigma-70 family)